MSYHLSPPKLLLNGTNYTNRKGRMSSFLLNLDYALWKSVTQKRPSTSLLNDSAIEVLISALPEEEYYKVGTCHSAKGMWDTLQAMYGNPRVVKARLEALRFEYDRFTMMHEESVSDMYARFMKIIAPMYDLGGQIKEHEQVQKILSVLPQKFQANVRANMKAFEAMKVAEFIGFLISREIRFQLAEDGIGSSVMNEEETREG